MTPTPSRPDGISIGRSQRWALAARFVPTYLWHATARPYRRRLSGADGADGTQRSSRHAAAALDAWVGQLLRAYGRTTGTRLRRESGPIAIHYIRLMAAMNREYEHQLAMHGALDLESLCAATIVADRIREWTAFTAAHTGDASVIDFLAGEEFLRDYDSYVVVTTQPGFDTDVDLQMESIALDSGGYLARLVRLVGTYHEQPPGAAVLRRVHHAGIAAKLADELVDLVTDHHEGRYNLLWALLQREPDELRRVVPRIRERMPMPVAWWRIEAANTLARLAALYERHYGRIEAGPLRGICDLAMMRAAGGPTRQQSARPEQHVTEPPLDSWR